MQDDTLYLYYKYIYKYIYIQINNFNNDFYECGSRICKILTKVNHRMLVQFTSYMDVIIENENKNCQVFR